ncbi:MAG: SDR family oxidoreductase [bacterium]|nr:SDR family oxidoreductase [bacterium]
MKIAVLGATGETGQQFVQQALAQGHELTLLVRTPGKIAVNHPKQTIVQGDARSLDDMTRTIRGQDAVFCALGSGYNLRGSDIRTEGTRQLIRAVKAVGENPHLVVLSSLGAGDSQNQMSLPNRMFVRSILHNVLLDHEAQEALVRESGLTWTILRPSGLNSEPPQGIIQASQPPEPVNPRMSVSRADVAAFALRAIEGQQYRSQTLTLTFAMPQRLR